MTAEQDRVVAKMDREEAEILARFAAGETKRGIANALLLDLGEVELVVDGLAHNSKDAARGLTMAWQVRAKAEPPVPTPVAEPAPAPDALAPTPPPPPVERAGWSDTIEALIGRAVAGQVPRLVRLADRIQDLVDQLEAQVVEHERGEELRGEAEKLEARLAEIRTQLKPRPAPAETGRNLPAIDSKAIRAWAAANDVFCPNNGRVPAAVVAKYEAAQS